MFIFATLTLCSIVLYVYYKVAILRSKDSLIQNYINGKAKISLGIFLISFAINQYIAAPIKVILFISIIFILLGIIQLVDGFNRAKHFRKEWKRIYPKGTKMNS